MGPLLRMLTRQHFEDCHFHLTFISVFCLPNGNGFFAKKRLSGPDARRKKNPMNPCKSVELDNSQIRDKKDTGPDGLFWLRLFPTPKSWSLFLFLKGVAHRRCAHRISASQLGELVLIEDRH